jgi:hypothetical protein
LTDDDQRLAELFVPGHSKFDLCRRSESVWVTPAHEALHEEVSNSEASLSDQVRESIVGEEWADNYNNHIVVKSNPNKIVHPYAIYVDGAPFTKNDGFVGFFIYLLATGTRHLSILLRKSNMCRCGCRGWCTIFVALDYLRYCCAQLARGMFSSGRYDRQPWRPSDGRRESWAGDPLALIAACIHIKCDWAEFASTFGLASWASLLHPCLCCDTDQDTMHAHDDVSLDNSPWMERTPETYDRDCTACEIWVDIPDVATHTMITNVLQYSRNKTGGLGLCAKERLVTPSFTIEKNDRIEPHRSMNDHTKFFLFQHFPVKVLFWRRSLETAYRHRNPLLDASIGITIDLFSIDTLHTWNLGPLQRYCMKCAWTLLDFNVWDIQGASADRHGMGVLRLRNDLFHYYKSLPQEHREKITELENLTDKCWGRAASRK